jgi:hypothetical protein
VAIAVDGSSPARWTDVNTLAAAFAESASFTAPANALLVVCVEADCVDGTDDTFTVTDSGGLTWTKRVERDGGESATGGYSGIHTARTTSAVARTVRATRTEATAFSGRISATCRVLTGADVDGTPFDAVTGSNEGGSTTNNLTTTSVTPGANGLLIVADCDFSASGAFEASSNLTQDTTTYATAVSVCDGYRTCTSGVALTANLNAFGSGGVAHKWCQLIVREAGGGGATVALEWQSPSSQPTNHFRPEIIMRGAVPVVPFLPTVPTRTTNPYDFIVPTVDVVWGFT